MVIGFEVPKFLPTQTITMLYLKHIFKTDVMVWPLLLVKVASYVIAIFHLCGDERLSLPMLLQF